MHGNRGGGEAIAFKCLPHLGKQTVGAGGDLAKDDITPAFLPASKGSR